MVRKAVKQKTERMDRPAVIRSVFRYILFLEFVQLGIALLMAPILGSFRLGLWYLAGAVPWTLVVGLVFIRNIHLLYTLEGRPLRRLNLATRVTLLRVVCIPLLVALILLGRFGSAAVLFLAAAFTDWLDGFLARRMKDVTQLGRIIDPTIDALFCSITLLALYIAGILPLWVLLAGALRYTLLTAGAAYLKLTFGYVSANATFAGRMFYLLQYGLLTLVLLVRHEQWAPFLYRGLGIIQLLVCVQLVFLGLGMLKEARIAAR